jgi:cell division protein FtsQ
VRQRHRLPQRSNFLVRTIFWLALVVSIGFIFWVLLPRLLQKKMIIWPVHQVVIQGALSTQDRLFLEHEMRDVLQKSMLTIDLAQLSHKMRAHHWLQVLHLQRHWPDQVWIVVRLRRPLLRWQEDWVVDRFGKRFHPRKTGDISSLPRLYANGSLSFREVYRVYHFFVYLLADVVSVPVHVFGFDAVTGWRGVLVDGSQFVLGRKHVFQRLMRLLTHWKVMHRPGGYRCRYDLRYVHGVAVRCVADDKGEALNGSVIAA